MERLKTVTLLLVFLLACRFQTAGQELTTMEFTSPGKLTVTSFNDGSLRPGDPLPLVSFRLGNTLYTSEECTFREGRYQLPGLLELEFTPIEYQPGYKATLSFRNLSDDTLQLHNVVPYGESSGHVYITGMGEHPLSRSHLFLPGRSPVNVILPDNAWELGFSAVAVQGGYGAAIEDEEAGRAEGTGRIKVTEGTGQTGVCALVRRNRESVEKGHRQRFETKLFPGGQVSYTLWADLFSGEWQQGLELMFRERMLYDVEPGTFDNTLFDREDLKWVRHAYVAHLMQAWDSWFYDYAEGKYRLDEFLSRGKKLWGGDDFTGIWPTWPSLGIDARNQWDLFRDLPGGLPQLKKLSEECRESGSALFICYNPWDESTRVESHTAGMAAILEATGARGVVLDTRGESSREFQEAADGVAPGMIMYSEGMAVPRDMQGIVAGRVHNALYYPPLLNLNKLIKPEFAIFRVAEMYKEPILREYNVAFFNGYGTELNIFAPGKPEWAEEQYRYLGRTSRILRENSPNFTSPEFTPLVPVFRDSVWVNEWPLQGKTPEKTLYTIYSTLPEGSTAPLIEVKPDSGFHFVDLWNHKELNPLQVGDRWMVAPVVEGFSARWLGTNNEGAVGCVARLPRLLRVSLDSDELGITMGERGFQVVNSEAGESPGVKAENRNSRDLLGQTGNSPGLVSDPGDSLHINPQAGDSLRVWAGMPEYGKTALALPARDTTVHLTRHFGRYEGKFVVQLMRKGILLDERVADIPPGTPRLVSSSEKITGKDSEIPAEMVIIPGGTFTFKTTHGDDFIPYPRHNQGREYAMPSFLMDCHPVTNRQYKAFLDVTGYFPADTANFLKYWQERDYPSGEGDFPVVYVSLEDARAYARWAGKRLPTEIEWQYAAQTSSGNEWPWKQRKPVKRVEQQITTTLTVSSLEGIDPGMCNPGDGHPYPTGKYRKGANPYGLLDLVGCVWQLTNDEYLNGSYRYVIMKGGSYFKPSSSWWYVQGGPRELHYRQMLLRVSPGFERNATVGFRCVKDIH